MPRDEGHLSETSLLPCSSPEQAASWFKMSFIRSRNGSTGSLAFTEAWQGPPAMCFLKAEDDTAPSKDKRWGQSISTKNDLGAERQKSN